MRFVSYNVQYGVGMDGRFDPERIANEVRDADIIAFQEVTRGYPKNSHIDLVERFAGLFPDHFHVYGAPCDVLLGVSVQGGKRTETRLQFGNMILSRWPILATRHLLLPRSRTISEINLQRGALEAVIATPGGPLRVYSTHLDHISPDERIAQIGFLKERVVNFVAEGGVLTGATSQGLIDPPLPDDFILMGDFNMEPGSPEYVSMVGHNDRFYGRALRPNQPVDVLDRLGKLSPESYTWAEPPGSNPDSAGLMKMHLDHCFVSCGLAPRVKNAWVDNDAQGSDHFPLWVEVA